MFGVLGREKQVCGEVTSPTNLEAHCSASGLVIRSFDGYEAKWTFAERHLLIAVDCFTKWVELVPLRTKESVELADWLVHELVPRYGVPRFIRVDAGLEFQGAFRACCDALGITLRRTSGGVP